MLRNRIRQQIETAILNSYEKMYRIAYSYVRNEDDALDIVQDSAYKAMKCADSVKSEQYIETWLCRIVINCAIDFIRKAKREVLSDIPEDFDKTGTTDTYSDFDTLEALQVLNETERAIIVLRFFEDKKIDDIATILDLNVNTTKTLLYRSLKKLKIELEGGYAI